MGTLLRQGQPVSLNENVLLLPMSGRRCSLLAGEDVLVNGFPPLPLRMLADRDLLQAGSDTVYFSTDSPAEAAPFAPQGIEISCARCKGKIVEGESAVQCPQCRAWHHQTESLGCWSFDSRCSGCDHPTAGIAWSPDPKPRRSGLDRGKDAITV